MLVQISEDVVHTRVQEHTMLMSIEAGKYYSLSPVGTHIWELLQEPADVDALVSRLLEEYDVAAHECRQDVSWFVGELLERGLVSRVE